MRIALNYVFVFLGEKVIIFYTNKLKAIAKNNKKERDVVY